MESSEKNFEKASTAIELLQEFRIDISEVAEHAQVAPKIARAALRAHCMETCPVIILIKVQTAAEILLKQRGWKGESGLLWRDFYAMLEAAEANC